MRNTSERSSGQKSGNSLNHKRENGSKRNSVSAKKRDRGVTYSKRFKLKSKSQGKTDTTRSNRKSSNLCTNENGKPCTKRTLNESLQKITAICSWKKQSSSIRQGAKSLPVSCNRHKNNAADEDPNRRKGQFRKRKRKKQNIVRDEASRLQRRTRYLLIRMKLEQNLIDAYSGEGWKGNSREKIKPEKELERAKKQILECKLGIREVIHQLDLISSDGRIEDSVIDPDGRVFHEYIFCAKCKLREAFPDNDIILCDGTCNRAFHQKCLEPPLATENIPPGDQGWFCKYCECKMEILEAVNAHLGTSFSGNCNWQEVFKEAVNVPDSEKGSLDPTENWPSEDSEDDDYDPEKFDKSFSKDAEESMSDGGGCSSGLFWSSDEASSLCEDSPHNNGGGFSNDKSRCDHGIHNLCEPALDSDNLDEVDTLNARRLRKDVDYKKLHDEMFGKEMPENEELSEDEDWGPCRRKRRVNEYHADITTASCADEDSCLNVNNIIDSRKEFLTETQDRKALFRIPASAVETLRRVFSENELPSKEVKENLSKQLGIDSEKINKWFKNARYMALKTRKAQGANVLCSNGIQRLSTDTERGASADKQLLDKTSLMSCSVAIGHVSSSSRIVNWRKSSKLPTLTLKRHNTGVSAALPPKAIEKLMAVLREDQSPSVYTKRKLSRQLGVPYRQVSTWFKNARNHKKSSLERKIRPEKKRHLRKGSPVKETNIDEQMYLVLLERLFKIEDKLHKLKRELDLDTDNTHTLRGTSSAQPTVVYVPIVEVNEKM